MIGDATLRENDSRVGAQWLLRELFYAGLNRSTFCSRDGSVFNESASRLISNDGEELR